MRLDTAGAARAGADGLNLSYEKSSLWESHYEHRKNIYIYMSAARLGADGLLLGKHGGGAALHAKRAPQPRDLLCVCVCACVCVCVRVRVRVRARVRACVRPAAARTPINVLASVHEYIFTDEDCEEKNCRLKQPILNAMHTLTHKARAQINLSAALARKHARK
jgi:hypothetical protein